MTLTETRRTSAEELVAAARSAVPVLAANADRAERDRRLPAESVAVLRDMGAFRLATPARFGGLDTDLPTLVRVVSELGRGCPSSAWLVAVSAEAQRAIVGPLMSQEGLAEFYANPDARLCGAGLPPGRGQRVDGGLRVTGRWPYASGCEEAPWAMTSVVVSDNGAGPSGFALLLAPTSELAIDRTWDSAGMRGTGSHTLVADDLFVPQAHILPVPSAPNGAPDLFRGRPAAPLAGAVALLASLTGAARGALDVVSSVLHERRPPLTQYASLAASPGARQWFGEATHLIDGAERDLLVLAAEVDQVVADPAFPERDGAALRMRLNSGVRRCQDGVNLLLDLHGAGSFAAGNPLQRFWRDLHVGSRHSQLTSYLAMENHARLVTEA